MEQFELEVNKRLDRIRDIVKTIARVHHRREYVSGDVREGYNTVMRTELNRMLVEVDGYKTSVCLFLSDIEATALLNHTKFPNLYYPERTDECVLVYDAALKNSIEQQTDPDYK